MERKARSILDQSYLLGVQERFRDAVMLFAREFGWSNTATPQVRVNRGRPRELEDEETRKLILAHSWLDAALHAECRERMDRLDSHAPSYARQRASFFPDGAPFHSFLPWSMQHGAASWWSLVVRGNRPPGMSRSEAASFAAFNFRLGLRFQMRRWARRRAKRIRGALFKRTLPALARPVGGDRGYRILAKGANRASDAMQDGARDPAKRVREILRVAGDTAAQLQRERNRSASARAHQEPAPSPSKAERDKAKRIKAKEKAKKLTRSSSERR